ncbi:MAG TPA: DinB family protein [Gemmatimonadaceae bacterium]
MTEEIQGLYAYNRWANQRFLDATEGLSAEELERDLRSSFPSVKATLEHILQAEWIWLERWNGVSPTEIPPWDTGTHAALRAQWRRIEQDQLAYVGGLTDELLQRVIDYRNFASQPFSQPLWQLLRHVVNHSTYHRGQVATMLRQLGHPVPVSDLVVYYREPPA